MARADVMAKRSQAVALARAGMSYDDIAKECGYRGRSGAWHAVHKALDDHQAEEVESLRALELARLDSLQAGLWPKAAKGEVDAVLAVLRIIDRRARLLGLYSNPVNQGVERGGGSVVNPEFWKHVHSEHGGDWRACGESCPYCKARSRHEQS